MKKTPAVTKNDSAGVTMMSLPGRVRALSPAEGRSRGCIPRQDPLHSSGNTPPCPGSARAARGLRDVLIPHAAIPQPSTCNRYWSVFRMGSPGQGVLRALNCPVPLGLLQTIRGFWDSEIACPEEKWRVFLQEALGHF